MIQRDVKTDGLTQRVLEAGPEDGPLVLLLHGFPELGVSWRAQVEALAAAGFRAVAPDMRGYGGTRADEGFTILNLVGDMVDLLRALGKDRCVVVGHDWGAPVAWHSALIRPDLFSAVAGLSVPFQPRNPSGPPIELMRRMGRAMGRAIYIAEFQDPDYHRAFDADPATALRKCFWAYDGVTAEADRSTGFIPPGVSLLDTISDGAILPPWMSEAHFAEYVAAFSASGFKGPVDWYRALDRNWELTAWLQDARIRVPGLFIVGENDPVRHYAGRAEGTLKDWVPDLRGLHVLPGAGHWLQQERAEEVNRLLLGFLTEIGAAD
jgi:pimeloyl-ACP methyl ester carboxylesterase